MRREQNRNEFKENMKKQDALKNLQKGELITNNGVVVRPQKIFDSETKDKYDKIKSIEE